MYQAPPPSQPSVQPAYAQSQPVYEAPPPMYQVPQRVYPAPQPAHQPPPPVYLARPSDQVPFGQHRTPVAWLVAIVAFAALFSLALPAVSDSLIQTRPAQTGEEFGLLTGSVVSPEGWDVSVPGAALGNPTLTQGGVRVDVITGFWQGDTEDLVARLLEWMVDARLPVTEAAVQPGLSYGVREVYRVDIEGSTGPGALVVVREEAAVAVVAVTSESPEPWSQRIEGDIEAIVDSVWLDPVPLLYAEETP